MCLNIFCYSRIIKNTMYTALSETLKGNFFIKLESDVI